MVTFTDFFSPPPLERVSQHLLRPVMNKCPAPCHFDDSEMRDGDSGNDITVNLLSFFFHPPPLLPFVFPKSCRCQVVWRTVPQQKQRHFSFEFSIAAYPPFLLSPFPFLELSSSCTSRVCCSVAERPPLNRRNSPRLRHFFPPPCSG